MKFLFLWIMFFSTHAYSQSKCENHLSESQRHTSTDIVFWEELTPGQPIIGEVLTHIPIGPKSLKKPFKDGFTVDDLIIPVVKVRNGDKVYLFVVDGHHKIKRSLFQFGKKMYVNINIIETIEFDNSDAYVLAWLHKNNYIFALSSQLKSNNFKFRSNWPQSFSEMTDYPARSALKWVFSELGWKGKFFQPYIQLHIADYLQKKGLVILNSDLKHRRNRKTIVKKIIKIMQNDAGIRKILIKYMNAKYKNTVLK
jgi:hypothetical protein